MLTCYLDDSGKDGRVTTLAGYVALPEAWQVFEKASDVLLKQYGVPIFHAKDFQDTKGVFKGWPKIKKRTFTKEWYDIARKTVIQGISISVPQEQFKKKRDELNIHRSLSAYGCCFSALVITLIREPLVNKAIERRGISFIVEAGNNNNSEIEKWFQKSSKDSVFNGCLKSISFAGKKSSRAIQIADFYAYYSRRWALDRSRFDNDFILPANAIHNIMKERVYHFEFVAKVPYADDGRGVRTTADFLFPG